MSSSPLFRASTSCGKMNVLSSRPRIVIAGERRSERLSGPYEMTAMVWTQESEAAKRVLARCGREGMKCPKLRFEVSSSSGDAEGKES